MIIDLLIIVFLVVFVEAVTEILVDSKIMAGLRAFVFDKANPGASKAFPEDGILPVGPGHWRFINDVLSCGYCCSVWVSMLAALFAPVYFAFIINWIIMVFVLHRMSNCFHIVLMIIKKGRVKTFDIELTHKQVSDGSSGQTGSP